MRRIFFSVLLSTVWQQLVLPNNGYLNLVEGTSGYQIFNVGHRMELYCCYNSSQTPVLKWYHKDKQIGLDKFSILDGFKVFRTYPKELPNGPTIYCSEIERLTARKSDKGPYTCLANNTFHTRKHEVYVSIKDVPTDPPLEVKAVNQNVKILPTGNATLSCTTKYVLKNSYANGWEFQNVSAVNSYRKQTAKFYDKGNNAPSILEMNLTITNGSKNDIGAFTCWVSNSQGVKFQDVVHLDFVIHKKAEVMLQTAPNDHTMSYLFAVLGVFIAFALLSLISFCERRRRKFTKFKARKYRYTKVIWSHLADEEATQV